MQEVKDDYLPALCLWVSDVSTVNLIITTSTLWLQQAADCSSISEHITTLLASFFTIFFDQAF